MKIHLSRRTRNHSRASRLAIAFGMTSFALIVSAVLVSGERTVAQAQTAGVQAVGSMSDVMVSMVYPATNNILLFVYRGGPQSDADWASVQRSAVLLADLPVELPCFACRATPDGQRQHLHHQHPPAQRQGDHVAHAQPGMRLVGGLAVEAQ